MKENGKTQCTRCRMGVPIGITIALIGLAGIIISAMNYESTGILTMTPYIALFLIGPPFARMATLVNGAHRRIDNLERPLN
jgi:hypothetical protein